MFNTEGFDIEVTRGDTIALQIHLHGREIPYGTDAIFTVKKRPRDTEFLIQKRMDASDGVVTLVLDPDDTNLTPRTYYWDLRVQIPQDTGGYEVYTPMEYAAFTVLDVVGGDIGTDGNPGMNPDLPILVDVLRQTEDVLARADATVSAIEALSVQATEADNPSADIVKNEDGSLLIAFGLPRGPQGLRGEQGEQGIQGEQGERGEAFTYEDFTAEQLAALRGEKGDTGDSGVYIGENPPADVKVWLMPEGDAGASGNMTVDNNGNATISNVNVLVDGNGDAYV